MTVQSNQAGTAPSCHASGSHAHAAHDVHGETVSQRPAGLTAALLSLPRPVQIIGGAAVVIGALLAVGVPLATLTPLLAVGGCLGMHLFMPGMNHGGGHGDHQQHGQAPQAGPDAPNPEARTSEEQ